MSDDPVLDQAAQIIADARVECLKLGASPQEIGDIMSWFLLYVERHPTFLEESYLKRWHRAARSVAGYR